VTGTADFRGTIHAEDGDGTPLRLDFTFTYPAGHGMALWYVLNHFGEQLSADDMVTYLIEAEDASFLARAAEIRRDRGGEL
jgi:hypothetical protein